MGALMKSDNQEYIEKHIPEKYKGLKITRKVRIRYKWYEPNALRDIDNISGFGHKVIQDALVNCGMLEDDDQKHIVGYTDDFFVDKKKPRIEITIEEV